MAERGDVVRIVSGKSAGATGTVFWIGPNKFGPGKRLGVRSSADAEALWVDETAVELAPIASVPASVSYPDLY